MVISVALVTFEQPMWTVMKNEYRYFDRDISWLSFNYRVLLEADDDRLPLYERINFMAIYSSNLEEFYKVRVAEHMAVASGGKSDDETPEEAQRIIRQISSVVNAQLDDRVRIYEEKLLPELKKNHIVLYQTRKDVPAGYQTFIEEYFREELFPYLQPVPIDKNRLNIFLRTNRLYLAVRVRNLCTGCLEYFIIKLPYSKVPRFIELPKQGEDYCMMFMEDIIKANLSAIFVGYEVDCSYCCKISRDADIFVDNLTTEGVLEQLRRKVKQRKIGAVCRFVYDRNMPGDFLEYLADAFGVSHDELVPGDKHLNMEDLASLPNPNPTLVTPSRPAPIYLKKWDKPRFMFKKAASHDFLMHYPYHSFDHFVHFLYEAVHDSHCRELMITQYRVAEHSEVINALISAAQNGKKVTVFVELKARFDEENNLITAEQMRKAGIHIIYSIPGLKVHAKVALALRHTKAGKPLRGVACISTGNFNEKTARVYADSVLYTSDPEVVNDVATLFKVLRQEEPAPVFKRLLVARFNLVPELKWLIAREIELAEQGKKGRIILKMNALQDKAMIDELYRASEAGVEIDLIVRGICCLVPGESFSRNIRVTRIVDSFLEHARIWYFGNDGCPKLFMGSPDWMRRNLYRRIEAVVEVTDPVTKQELTDLLDIQLKDNRKACWLTSDLKNCFKKAEGNTEVRSQYDFYDYLKKKSVD